MTDFLVVGGGIAGISAAARLSELGSVLLLEAEDALARHASGRSAALFERSYGAPAVIALNEASEDDHREAGVLSPRGLMLVSRDAGDAAFDADRRAMKLMELSPGEARSLCPILAPDVTRAAHDASAWDIDTDGLMQHYSRRLRANGGAIRTRAPVGTVARTRSGWAVTAGGETHEARTLVNAAGAWADLVAVLAGVEPVGLQPFRRSMARIALPTRIDPSAWPMLFGAGEAWYAKPDAGALIVSPAEEDPVEPHDAWADDMVLAEGLARYEAHVTEPVTRMLANWAGLRTFALDRQLVLGPDPADPAFVWCAGQGGYGFQTAPAASRLLADVVAGRSPGIDRTIVAGLEAARFRRG